MNPLKNTQVQNLPPQTATELLFQPGDCGFELLEMHTHLSQTARQTYFDIGIFLYDFSSIFPASAFPIFSRESNIFFGSCFSLMADAVGREVQMVRINGDYREFHGVKNHAATDSGDFG